MTVTQRRFDDDDSDLYDPAYYPRKVVRDGGRVSVLQTAAGLRKPLVGRKRFSTPATIGHAPPT